jgi:hypothetical protein
MLPPRLLRRLVLAPLAVVMAVAVAVLFPLLAPLTLALSLLRHGTLGRMRAFRLLFFTLVWLCAESAALFMSLGLWMASGFGGRLDTEPYHRRHYAVMRWYLDLVFRAAVRLFGLRVVIDEPESYAGTSAAASARPVIVASRHAGPGDTFLLVRYLLTRYGRRPHVVMKDTMQLDPGLDVMANRVPNVFIRHQQAGQGRFVEQIERLSRGARPGRRTGDLPGGRQLDPEAVAAGHPAAQAGGPARPGRPRAGDAQRPGAPVRRSAVGHRRLPRGRRDLRGPRRPGPARQRGRCLAQPAAGPGRARHVVAGAGRRGAALRGSRGAGAVAV